MSILVRPLISEGRWGIILVEEVWSVQYTLMHKNVEVARIEIDDISCSLAAIREVHNPEYAPLGTVGMNGKMDRMELHRWWFHRAIPISRPGLREALGEMGLDLPQQLVEKCMALSLSDQYWVRPLGAEVRWEDVNFFMNAFSADVGNILFGGEKGVLNLVSPDNTSDGCLKKKWKAAGEERLLIKGGNGPMQQEPFNEVFAAGVMRDLGVDNYVPYWLTWEAEMPYSVCANFVTGDMELVNAGAVMKVMKKPNHVSMYEHFLNCCNHLGVPGIRESIDQMLTVDFLIANTDRHWNNFGVMRNADTLEWVGMAPVFDCGSSMWCDEPTSRIDVEDVSSPSKPFQKNHKDQIRLVQDLSWIPWDRLKGLEALCAEVFSWNPYMDDYRREKLCRALGGRVEWLRRL